MLMACERVPEASAKQGIWKLYVWYKVMLYWKLVIMRVPLKECYRQ